MQVFICTMVGCHSIYQGALSLMILAYLHGKQGLQNTKFRNIPFQNVGSFLQVLTIDVVYTMSSYDQFSFYLPSSFFFWCLWCITWKTGPFKILSSETSHLKIAQFHPCSNNWRSLYYIVIQLCRLEMAPVLNKYYWNEVTLTGQNPPLRFCSLLSFSHSFKRVLNF